MICQECPTCRAKPGLACVVPYSNKHTTEHASRQTTEYGDWTVKFDREWVDTSKPKFRIRKYGRRAA